jgi:hypothetical protein
MEGLLVHVVCVCVFFEVVLVRLGFLGLAARRG